MKPAEVRRELVRERIVRRRRDSKWVRVRVRTYRVERPVVHEVIEASGVVYVRSLVGTRHTIARVNRISWMPDISKWAYEVEADGTSLVWFSMCNAERYARRMLHAAGYRVKRAKP